MPAGSRRYPSATTDYADLHGLLFSFLCCPFRARHHAILLPRALPWAKVFWPFGPQRESGYRYNPSGRNVPVPVFPGGLLAPVPVVTHSSTTGYYISSLRDLTIHHRSSATTDFADLHGLLFSFLCCPFRARHHAILLPRALPWAKVFWPFGPQRESGYRYNPSGRNVPVPVFPGGLLAPVPVVTHSSTTGYYISSLRDWSNFPILYPRGHYDTTLYITQISGFQY